VLVSCQSNSPVLPGKKEVKSVKAVHSKNDTLLLELREHLLQNGWITEENILKLDSFSRLENSYTVFNLISQSGKQIIKNRWVLYLNDMYLVDFAQGKETFFYSATNPPKPDNRKMFNPFTGKEE
jgi:hypothetical protein